jgi:ABC-type uncharacterized transport system auxiliary subunit
MAPLGVSSTDEDMEWYEKFFHGKGQKFALWGIPLLFSITLLLVASQVSPKEPFDMILNAEVYPYPPFSFREHFRQSLQVKVIRDNRPEYQRVRKNSPVDHIQDSSWAEPPKVMVEKVLEREFLLSNLFDSVTRHDESSSLLLEIDLNSFCASWSPGRSGLKPIFTIHGDVELKVSLISRKDGKILLNKNYREKTEAIISQFRNEEGYAAVEVGKALKSVTATLMGDIKGVIERLEIEEKGNYTPGKKGPPKKQRAAERPEKPEHSAGEPRRIVLEPIGPK